MFGVNRKTLSKVVRRVPARLPIFKSHATPLPSGSVVGAESLAVVGLRVLKV